MMRTICLTLGLAAAITSPVLAQGEEPQEPKVTFEEAALEWQRKFERRTAELTKLRKQIADEKLELSPQLRELERKLAQKRIERQAASAESTASTVGVSDLTDEIDRLEKMNRFLSSNITDYLQGFQTRLHTAESQRYADPLREINLALENDALSEADKFAAQAGGVELSIERLFDVAGGTRFEGRAIDESGLLTDGTFVVIGPTAVFQPKVGEKAGAVEQQANAPAPVAIPFHNPADNEAAAELAALGEGKLPFDPSGGNASKLAATEESFFEHVQKGGPVMIPIFVMAGAALLVALFKWISMMFVRRTSKKRMKALLDAVAQRDQELAREQVVAMRGPVGSMLRAGVDNLGESRELIEEVMYEKVLTSRLQLNRFLPFIAVCAASAPLLGLLGTVTGIIDTFKLITVFGSGDPKTLSGGISEALITTKFGLIVAIPSLLLHAYLSHKARAIVSRMEMAGVAFVNQVAKYPLNPQKDRAAQHAPAVASGAPGSPDPDLVREQVQEILAEMLGEGASGHQGGSAPPAAAVVDSKVRVG